MNGIKRIWTKAEKIGKNEARLSRVLEFENGDKVAIPIHKDGSVKWFDDTKLIKKAVTVQP